MKHALCRFGVLVSSALLLPILGGCVAPEASFNELIAEGQQEFEGGRYAAAVAMFKDATRGDPERPEPAYHIGRCYLAMADREFYENDLPGALGYCDRAIASFDQAIAAFPGYSLAVQGKADALRLRGRQRAALDIADWVAAQSGFSASKLILKAREYADVGDVDKAQLTYIQAAAVDPENARAHAALGLFYLRLNNKRGAVKSLKRAYELNPGAPGVFTALIELGETPDYPSGSNRRGGS